MFKFDLNHPFQRVLVLRSFICWNISFSKYQTKNTSVYIFKLILKKWLGIFVQTWFQILLMSNWKYFSREFWNGPVNNVKLLICRISDFKIFDSHQGIYNEGPFICWNVEFGEYRTSSIGIDIFEMVMWLMPICYYFE